MLHVTGKQSNSHFWASGDLLCILLSLYSAEILHRSGPDETARCISASSQGQEEWSLQFQTGCAEKVGTELQGVGRAGRGGTPGKGWLCTQEAQTSGPL